MVATQRQPILSQRCALAATAAESRYRIDRPNSADRVSRVVALDVGAEEIVQRLEQRTWVGARFFTYQGPTPINGKDPSGQIRVRARDGSVCDLSEQLDGSDVIVMIATSDAGTDGADTIGQACAQHGVMTAGLVVGNRAGASAAVNTLRPNAMVLVILEDEQDAVDVLTALRV